MVKVTVNIEEIARIICNCCLEKFLAEPLMKERSGVEETSVTRDGTWSGQGEDME